MFKRSIRFLSRRSYALAAKPLFFMMSPDKAHAMMISMGAFLGKMPPLLWLVKTMFGKNNRDSLKQSFHGIDYSGPVGLSAGLDKNGEIIPMIARLGFGFGTVGSVTADVCDGNPRPWFHRLPATKSIVVNAGLANVGSASIIKHINEYSNYAVDDFPVVLSIAKTNSCQVVSIAEGIKDYVTTVKRAQKEPRIQALEINISCPNTYGGEPFTTPDRLKQLLKAIDDSGNSKPTYVKMPVDLSWKDFKALLDVIVKHRIVGVTIANLTKTRALVSPEDKISDDIRGHLSGKPTTEVCNDKIRRTYVEYGKKLTIIGVGGIFNAQDAYAKIRLGASLVEVITGLIFNGPQLAADINAGLDEMLKRDGFTHISQAIGVDAKK